MKTKKYIKLIVNLIMLISFASCTSTQEITRRSEMIDSSEFDELKIYTAQEETFILSNYMLKDSVIIGSGTKIFNDVESTVKNGTINLSDIRKIEGSNLSTLKIVLGVGVITALAIVFLVFINKEKDNNNKVVIVYPGGCAKKSSMGLHQDENRLSAAGFNNYSSFVNPEITKIRRINIRRGSDILSVSVEKESVNIRILPLNSDAEDIKTEEVVNLDIDKDNLNSLISNLYK